MMNTVIETEAPVSLREWGVFIKIKQMVDNAACGDVCSLRFSWQLPAEQGTSLQAFFERTFAGLIGLAEELGGAQAEHLHVEVVAGQPILLAILQLTNGVVAEFELNEALPQGMEATRLIQVDGKLGRLTNRPLVGHFTGEGAVFASAKGVEVIRFRAAPVASDADVDARIVTLVQEAIGGAA